jgi:hypothetical protein
MKITVEQRLKMMSKVMRETCHTVKPMVTKDKKKENNKYICRVNLKTENNE